MRRQTIPAEVPPQEGERWRVDPPSAHAVWCRRESFRQALRDVRSVASKASSWLHYVQLFVLTQEAHERTLIVVHVHDDATQQSYCIPIPEGLVRYDIARFLISEIRNRREEAGAASWQLALPGPWLIS
jgi:hypothetical protein